MKERFKQLPEAMQKQIIVRFAVAVFFTLLFFAILFGFRDGYLYLPCLFFAGFFIVNAISLLYNSIKGNYISVGGICKQIEATPIRKRIKSITLEYEEEKTKFLTVSIRQILKRLAVGDTVIVYIPEKTTVYSRDGGYLIYGYYAIEIKKEHDHDKSRSRKNI